MQLHNIKLDEKYYKFVFEGSKTFEVRNDDRNYQVGDLVRFINPKTNEEICVWLYKIKYIIRHADFPEGIKEGYCVFAIEKYRS